MSAQVAVYVQSKYAKPAYTVESYNVRAWPGLEMICHALRQAGIEVDYCSSATAGRYKVVLMSITSGCDWYPFIGERLRWPATARPVVIAGGAGLLNVRPFLRWCDVFCLGRSEEYVVPVVRAALAGVIGPAFRSLHRSCTRTYTPRCAGSSAAQNYLRSCHAVFLPVTQFLRRLRSWRSGQQLTNLSVSGTILAVCGLGILGLELLVLPKHRDGPCPPRRQES